jgi:LAO/AO transport system kinase
MPERRMHSDYLERFRRGDVLAASRLMSVVEGGGSEAEAVLTALYPAMGRAYRIGVTGLTGAGKSSLVNRLIRRYRDAGLTVGVIAEDPTSPFSGGAILGDRVRMIDAVGDDGVFIRSIASRGGETGLSACAIELADLLDAFGRDIIFLETIGIGQLEYRIRFSSDTTIVVLTPDAGDDVQSLKSGLMEVGDIFVVNKSDRESAARFAEDLRSMLDLRAKKGEWIAPVVATIATEGDGIEELGQAITNHRDHLAGEGRFEARRVEIMRNRIALLAEERLRERFWGASEIATRFDEIVGEALAGKRSPYEAAGELASIRDQKGEG